MVEDDKTLKIDFGELFRDEDLKTRINSFNESMDDIRKVIDTVLDNDVYDDLSPSDKVRYDLFLSFAINSLFWCYLRTQGIDPSQHDIKNEINRVKEYMAKSRKLYEQKTIMPRLDQGAAKRFVRAGLFDPNQPQEKPDAPVETETQVGSGKRKREDSEGE